MKMWCNKKKMKNISFIYLCLEFQDVEYSMEDTRNETCDE